jgi:hypothetical protein
MKRIFIVPLLAAAAACNSGGGGNEAAGVAPKTENASSTARAELPPCPFQQTQGWAASVEDGRMLVTGEVDLQMAGFKPTLTPREAGGGVAAFDLALKAEPNAAVTAKVRYERGGSPRYSRVEIWCGGERVATTGVVNI